MTYVNGKCPSAYRKLGDPEAILNPNAEIELIEDLSPSLTLTLPSAPASSPGPLLAFPTASAGAKPSVEGQVVNQANPFGMLVVQSLLPFEPPGPFQPPGGGAIVQQPAAQLTAFNPLPQSPTGVKDPKAVFAANCSSSKGTSGTKNGLPSCTINGQVWVLKDGKVVADQTAPSGTTPASSGTTPAKKKGAGGVIAAAGLGIAALWLLG